jgi:hypothetical protein
MIYVWALSSSGTQCCLGFKFPGPTSNLSPWRWVLSKGVALATLHYKIWNGPDNFLSSFKKINSSPNHIQNKTAFAKFDEPRIQNPLLLIPLKKDGNNLED